MSKAKVIEALGLVLLEWDNEKKEFIIDFWPDITLSDSEYDLMDQGHDCTGSAGSDEQQLINLLDYVKVWPLSLIEQLNGRRLRGWVDRQRENPYMKYD